MEKLKILVVDDEEYGDIMAKSLEAFLGHEAVWIDSPTLAIKNMEESGEFDLIITDRNMPGTMTGEELAHRAKKIKPDIKVILMTGQALSVSVTAAISAAGCDAIIIKPFKIDELGKMIRLLFWK